MIYELRLMIYRPAVSSPVPDETMLSSSISKKRMPPLLRALLILGRVSNLPTVWSNCLAGWWLGGGQTRENLFLALLGLSMLYLGGAFLNDAFDADFDRQHRPSRPIPSGAITRESVWGWSLGFLAAGAVVLAFISKTAGFLALILIACIVLYNAAHKAVIVSPWLIGLCRFWVYVISGAAGADGINGWPIWCGVALAFYVAGMSFVVQRGRGRRSIPWWPLALLAAPMFLAFLMNAGVFRLSAMCFALLPVGWAVRSLRPVFAAAEPNLPRLASNLLAGIVFVDWLAVAPQISRWMSAAVFLTLFAATKLLQRFAPVA
jgi:hypothetical protein